MKNYKEIMEMLQDAQDSIEAVKLSLNPYYKYEDEITVAIEYNKFNFDTNRSYPFTDFIRTDNTIVEVEIVPEYIPHLRGGEEVDGHYVPAEVRLTELVIEGNLITEIPDSLRDTIEEEFLIAVTHYYNEQLNR